ncbi:hypothetical protein CspHIS471_0210190 [Cutaneotrichosporon sp. HIS471]|nr:hypothetical protein CspHIS471_0210190 [Cutaneotrichosporon sp. HIS471]
MATYYALALFSVLQLIVAAELFPTYTLVSSKIGPSTLRSDIAGSAFVDADGEFHFVTSTASYKPTDDGSSFVHTFTADNFGVMMANGSTTNKFYDTFWNLPGSYCYQLDKRSTRPMPTLYQDDHCDTIGIWIDPATQGWYRIVNDEYQFAPWKTGLNQTARISTGLHNNRVLLSHSADKGVTWDLVDQILTDKYQPQQTITAALFPNQTYSWGLSGTRFFVDHVSGYAYALYNHQIRNKSGDATICKWFGLARAPLAQGLAPGNWMKWANGRWDQPGIGGTEDPIDEPLGFKVNYDPITDYLAFEGTGADGSSVAYKSVPFPAGSSWSFTDGSGNKYTVNTATNVITRSDNIVVPSVSYLDPALGRTITVGTNSKDIVVNSTDSYGFVASMSPTAGKNVFKDTKTDRLYVHPLSFTQTAFSYNPQSSKYRAVGYDKYAYELADLGTPNKYRPVGKGPDIILKHAAYMSSLDTGSLTNQRVSSRTYALISDLWVSMDTISVTPHSVSQTSFSEDAVLKDSTGATLANSTPYHVAVGGSALTVGGASDQWSLEPIYDTYQTAYRTGFFRLKSTSGAYLSVTAGTSVAAERKWGAVLTTGVAQPAYDPAGNNGMGSPGGSDQWYLLPIGANTAQVLDSSSSPANVQAAQKTSLNDAIGYKLVNRNSDLVVALSNGVWQIVPNEFAKNPAQKVTFTK